MRILQLGRFWKLIGGVQMHAQLLCKGLAAQGVDVVDLVASLKHERSDQRVNGFRMVEAASFGVHFATAISPDMVRLARQLHREQPFDLIHLHFPDPMSHLVSLAMPAQIPRVITWHSDIVKQKHLLKLYRPFQRREIMRARAIVAPTAAHFASSTQIPGLYPSAQRHIIPFGMDYSLLDMTPTIQARMEQVRARAGIRMVVFALGRHVEYKGFDVLLDALQHTQAYLVLGGDGPLTPALQAQALQLGLSDRVWFAGRLSDEDMAACYHACDVFCLSSVSPNEAFGLVQLEAMACGKPVICTQLNNGVNAVNPHEVTGLTVPVRDAPALGHAIEKLRLNEPLRQRLGQQAYLHARGTYSMQAMSEQHIRLYQDLLSTCS